MSSIGQDKLDNDEDYDAEQLHTVTKTPTTDGQGCTDSAYNNSSYNTPLSRTDIIQHKLLHGLEHRGGATVSYLGELLTTGFVVSVAPDLEHTFPTTCDAEYEISHWLRNMPKVNDDYCFGIWQSDDTVYLDINLVFNYEDTAVSLGEWYKQKAIFDIAGNRSIWITHK